MHVLPPVLVFLAHSVLLCAAALLATRLVRRPEARAVVLRAALLGAPLTVAFSLVSPFAPRLAPDHAVGAALAAAGTVVGLGAPAGAATTAPASRGPADPLTAAGGPPSAATRAGAPSGPSDEPSERPLLVLGVALALARGVTALAVRVGTARRVLGQRVRLGSAVDARSAARVLAALRAVGSPRRVHVSVCERIGAPLALGAREIVLPAGLLARLDDPELRAVLAHEVAHLERRDPIWLGAARGVTELAWFQPLLRVVLRRLEHETELAADARALARTGRPLDLARALERVAAALALPRARPALHAGAGMVSRTSDLVARVARLAGPEAIPPPRGTRAIALASGLGLALAACASPRLAARGQDTPDAAADVEVAERFAVLEPAADAARPDVPTAQDPRLTDAGPIVSAPYTGPDAEPGERRYRLRLTPEAGLLGGLEGPDALAYARLTLESARREMLPIGTSAHGLEVIADRVVLEVEEDAPFSVVQHWMAALAGVPPAVWRIELGTYGAPDTEVVSVFVPTDIGVDAPVEELEEEGAQGADEPQPVPGRESVEVRLDRDATGLRISIGPRTLTVDEVLAFVAQRAAPTDHGAARVTVDARADVRSGDVLPLIRRVRAAGMEVSFLGSYEPSPLLRPRKEGPR